MSGESLHIRRVHVKKSPGIPDPFLLDGLCDGVNLIYGPNASGKSSTARAIEAVLWPSAESARAVDVTALYAVGDLQFRAQLESGHLGVQCNGVDSRPPELPAPEFRQRYQLALHDLLLASEKRDRFAAEIARQSVGGYDFPKAADALGCREKPSSASLPSLRKLEDARRRLKDATERQAALHAQAQRLGELEALTSEASSAQARERVLAKAVNHARLASECEAARLQLAGLPAVLERMGGEEASLLEKLEAELAAAVAAETAEAQRAADAENAASTAMPHGPLAFETIVGLKERAAALSDAERTVAEAERRVRDAEAQVTDARHAIGNSVTDAQLNAIDGESFDDLAAFARDADRLDGRRAAADAELRIADEGTTQHTVANLETLATATRLLVQWLQESSSAPDERGEWRRAVLGWTLGLVAMLGWGIAALTGHPAAWLGVPTVVVIATIMLRRDRSRNDGRVVRERDYAALGIEPPKRWSAEDVSAHLDVLQRQVADARTSERRAQWAADARGRRAALDQDLTALDARRTALAQRLGVAPDGDARRLAWIAEQITAWRGAMRLLRGAEGALGLAREQQASAQSRVAEVATQVGCASSLCAADAVALSVSVAEHQRQYEQATERAMDARAREQQAAVIRGQIVAAIDQLYDSCECTRGDSIALRVLCAKRPDYAAAEQSLRLAERDHQMARQLLEADALFESGLLTINAEDLEASRARAAELAGQFESRMKEQTELLTLVNQAKKQSDIERLLAEVSAAEEDLRSDRRRDLRAMLGHALVAEVQRQVRDQHRPAVFHRARELFTVITRGAYILEFQDVDGAAEFRARDAEGTEYVHALGELSSATRVQLLLAVRVAFVETQENGVRLPIFLDETLGTSDDDRAKAIIEAVIALAAEGRQVFYLTAQRDEVGKWAAELATRSVEYRTFNLAELRKLDGAKSLEVPIQPLPVPVEISSIVPLPAEHTHESYGSVLAVPPVRPGAGSAAATHLWYLIDELAALHHCLESGVTTWGALENLVENGDVKVLEEWPQGYARARVRARAIEVMHEQARIGRARAVDRQVLRDSGAVSERMMGDVLSVAVQCQGSAVQLLAALQGGKVSGFQAKKLSKLREFLEQEGFISDQPPLSPAQIRAEMLGTVTGESHQGMLPEDIVDQLLRCIELRTAPISAAVAGYEPASPVTTMTPPLNELET